jgi:hypothetical protein
LVIEISQITACTPVVDPKKGSKSIKRYGAIYPKATKPLQTRRAAICELLLRCAVNCSIARFSAMNTTSQETAAAMMIAIAQQMTMSGGL